MFLRSCSLIFGLLGASAMAATKLEIRQVDTVRRLAVVAAPKGVQLEPGQTLIATSNDGTQCGLVVQTLVGTMATADTSNCQFGDTLRVGQPLEISLINSANGPTPVP